MTIPSTCITSLFLQNRESQSSNKTNPASRSIGHPQLTEKLLLLEGRRGTFVLFFWFVFWGEGGGCTQRLGLTWTFVLARCVLAGDHLQLPPTIISVEAAKQGLEVTLMERLTKLLGDSAVRMLTTQYRCVKQEVHIVNLDRYTFLGKCCSVLWGPSHYSEMESLWWCRWRHRLLSLSHE